MKAISPFALEGLAIAAASDTKVKSVLSVNALHVAEDWAEKVAQAAGHWMNHECPSVTVEPLTDRVLRAYVEELSGQSVFSRRYADVSFDFQNVSSAGLRPIDWWIPKCERVKPLNAEELLAWMLPVKSSTPRLNARRTRHGFTLVADKELEVVDYTLEGSNNSYTITAELSLGPWWTEVVEYHGQYYATLGQDRVLSALRMGISRIPVVLVHSDDPPIATEPWRLSDERLLDPTGPVMQDFLSPAVTFDVVMRPFLRIIRTVHEELDVPTLLLDDSALSD